MATPYTWPTSLPQQVDRGFTESVGITVLRTPMDAGPAKLRRRTTRPEILNVTFLMTDAQVATLEDFVLNTLQGVFRFSFIHPRKQVLVETRVVPTGDGQYFSVGYKAPGFWTVSLQLEIIL